MFGGRFDSAPTLLVRHDKSALIEGAAKGLIVISTLRPLAHLGLELTLQGISTVDLVIGPTESVLTVD